MPQAVVLEPNGTFSITEAGFKRVVTMFIQEVPDVCCVLLSFEFTRLRVAQWLAEHPGVRMERTEVVQLRQDVDVTGPCRAMRFACQCQWT